MYVLYSMAMKMYLRSGTSSWVRSPTEAMQFPTQAEAEAYVAEKKLNGYRVDAWSGPCNG